MMKDSQQGQTNYCPSCEDMAKQIAELERRNAMIAAKAQAVVDRWETPKWKDAAPTADVIYALRDALSATSADTEAWLQKKLEEAKQQGANEAVSQYMPDFSSLATPEERINEGRI